MNVRGLVFRSAQFLLIASGAAVAHAGILFQDSFGTLGNQLDLTKWTTEIGKSSFQGRTQLADWVTPGGLGKFVVGASGAQLTLNTFNPTGQSFYGTHGKTLASFLPTAGTLIEFTSRLQLTTLQPGLVYGTYLYGCASGNCETLHDEIDIELVTNQLQGLPLKVQLNRYANEPQGAGNGGLVNLPAGFDPLGVHYWTIRWSLSRIDYLVDGVLLGSATDHVPQRPMQVTEIAWAPDFDWPDAFSSSLQYTNSAGGNQGFTALLTSVTVSSISTQFCAVGVDQPTMNVAAFPTVVVFNVIAPSNCTWTLQSNVPWLNILLNSNGANTASLTLSGNRALALDIRRNTSSLPQQGTVVINGTVVTVYQAGSTDATNLRFVYVAFNNFLAREPGTAGISFFQPLLDSGTLIRAQMAYNMFGAPEFNAIERFVIGLYYGILGRDPDYYGWDFHRRNLHLAIVTQDTLVAQFLATPEYAAKYGSPTNDGFVTLLFQNALGRNPSAGDVAAWSVLLTNGTLTRTQVAQAFLNSAEFQTGAQARQTVFLLHATMLSRDPGTVGYTAWLEYFNLPGSALYTAVNAFVVSPEFQAKLGPN